MRALCSVRVFSLFDVMFVVVSQQQERRQERRQREQCDQLEGVRWSSVKWGDG